MSPIVQLSHRERVDWVRLSRTPNVGPVTFAELLKRYQTPANAIAHLPELTRKRPLTPPSQMQVEDEIAASVRYGGQIIAACEPAFPDLLRALDPPPPILTVLGKIALLQTDAIAIVGARNASAAGRKIARDMAQMLGQSGYTIVSGMARGIDGEAHVASLATGTIAVLGGGIDHIYPPQHDRLYAALAGEGLIVSDSPFGHRATAKDFPRRNRLITGLALGTVIVEAAERSGSLISARTAMEQNREVMAVPGSPLDPRASGTNRLIQQGAALVRSGDDVINIISALNRTQFQMPLPPSYEYAPAIDNPPPQQIAAVKEALSPTPMTLDELARAANIGPARCAAILMELELQGEAVTLPGGLAMLAP